MLFYDAVNPAPNPRRVRIYLAEKGLSVPTEILSIVKGEHRAEPYLSVNPLGQIPALKLDDGTVLTESVSICRFFEAMHPEPPMFGTNPTSLAEVDMWTRRIELRLMIPLGMVWVHTHPFTARIVKPQYTEYGESQRPRVLAAMAEFDRALADRDWLDGKSYSIADIVLLTTIDFAAFVGIAIPDDLVALRAWHDRASARPSAQA
ncbi:glutathione S-transferase family protein [Sphingomonas sp. So64.6b]|uniref:glutathione S-transferase family protein n=1 Tax=Sphingomonas sp. So64.6b TaxID=2997354 RepID=UPI0016030246|nr:glutathione S-transferase family protein [Sphingomonas sp. So64.6b]QNA83338.1 glutathione S-transferase family protein [Sphingomonas sp. So64.6b]